MQLTLIKSLKEMESTYMISNPNLLEWTMDVECVIFISNHDILQKITLHSVILSMDCLDSTKSRYNWIQFIYDKENKNWLQSA